MILRQAIQKLILRENLEPKLCQESFEELLKDDCNQLQAATFLALLRAKSETPEELTSIAQLLRSKMTRVNTSHKILDLVGTGGDGAHTVNISTGSALLAAACGAKVAKHGNRAFSSKAGSADVLEALGISISLSPEKTSACIDELGFAFCFAPNFHNSLLKLKKLRNNLGIPTTINLLGPLLNPTNPAHILLGVLNKNLIPTFAEVLQKLGTTRSMIVHGCGLDEISTAGITTGLEIRLLSKLASVDEVQGAHGAQKSEHIGLCDALSTGATQQFTSEVEVRKKSITSTEITPMTIDPKELGFAPCSVDDLRGGKRIHQSEEHENSTFCRIFSSSKGQCLTRKETHSGERVCGGDAKTNAELLRLSFSGAKGPISDTLILNAAVALKLYGLHTSLTEAIEQARDTLYSGSVLQLLNKLIEFSHAQ